MPQEQRKRYILHYAQGYYRELPDDFIFVFGSNLRGAHGKGAAECAKNYFGAIYGKGEGIQGQSYAVPTKDHNIKTRDISDIRPAVDRLIEFANANKHKVFIITELGTGLARLDPGSMAGLFYRAPLNCVLPFEWGEYLPVDSHVVVSPLNANWRRGDEHPLYERNTPWAPKSRLSVGLPT